MPLSAEKLFKRIAVFSDFSSIFYILYSVLDSKDSSMSSILNNPAFTVLVIAGVATIISYLIPPLWRHFRVKKNLLFEISSYIGILAIIIVGIILWTKGKNNSITNTVSIVKPIDSVMNVPLVIPKTTSVKEINTSKNKTSPKKQKNVSAISQKNENGKNEANQNTGTNNGNIGGEGNTVAKNVVQWDNYGHNGDTYNEPQITEALKLDVLKSLDIFKKENNMGTVKCIFVGKISNSNAFTLTIKLREYLEANGYESGGSIGSIGMPDFNGYQIIKFMGCLEVIVGIMPLEK